MMHYPSINKAKILLSWKPKIDFLKGLQSTIKNYNDLI